MKSTKVAITQLAIETDTQVTHHVVAMEKVAEQHIFRKCSKCNTFQVMNDLLLSKSLKVTITQLCNEPQVWNFTMLWLPQNR